MRISPFKFDQLDIGGNKLEIGNVVGSGMSLAVSQLAKTHEAPFLVITPDLYTLDRTLRELNFFLNDEQIPLLKFPDWETLPYDHFSPHKDLISERLRTLYKLTSLKRGIIIAALPTLMHRLPPKNFIEQNSFLLSQGERIVRDALREKLISSGYRAVDQVIEHGEFAIRGAVMDIFPMGSALPYRFELFDDEVETIRSFETESQRTIEKIDRIELLPAHEYPLTEEAITLFRQNWRNRFSGNPMESPLYKSISGSQTSPGIEYYLSLFFQKTETLFNYLPSQTNVLMLGDLHAIANQFWQEINHRYEQLRYDINRPLVEPKEIFTPVEEIFAQLKTYRQIHLQSEKLPERQGNINLMMSHLPQLLINHKAQQPFHLLVEFMQQSCARVLFTAETIGRKTILLDLLRTINVYPHSFEQWQDFANSKEELGIVVAPLDEGFKIDDPEICLITEPQLFGEQVLQRRVRKAQETNPDLIIRNLTELNIGSPVVHRDHGVGRYQGLKVITANDIEAEYLTLEYEGSDKIYVPVSSLHLISRYTGADPEHAPLHKLGSKKWEKTKEKVEQQIRDVAAELLDIYSRRQASPGFTFNQPNGDFQLFRSSFAFEETADQTRAINEVIGDMTQKKSMDRLVCGDVGFGKTEVAMQAAFLATQSAKQVAVLVPTTLLANQHYQTFQERFADWPIKIASLSRFRSQKERTTILKDLSEGKIDIVVGTHALIQKNITFKDLGLLIVDEEHRFGVRQKEQIKALRAHVDILTLTATPIPRTLNMAMAGTRDLSIITTPPARRLAIRTFIQENESSIIREAILREMMRGGQVYFLHNDIASIERMRDKLQKIAPDAHIAVAHGQMPKHELERIMSDFYHQKYNVLISTTIIESGIDVPTANTIIINKADHFGLAQLHQLRGRVGRSHHQAYAYLLVDSFKNITSDAQKRLEALASMEDLGAGFHLAMHDLEIRGAGELLGEEQSGHIQEVGFSLYMELLEDAVNALKSGKEPSFSQPMHQGTEIDLHVSALIRDNFVPDVFTRLSLYKRIANCKTQEDLGNIKIEMIDRFGLLPDVTQNLFSIAELKLKAKPFGIKKIDVGFENGFFQFEEKPNIDPSKIIELIQKNPKDFQLQGNRLRFKITETKMQLRLDFINNLMLKLKI